MHLNVAIGIMSREKKKEEEVMRGLNAFNWLTGSVVVMRVNWSWWVTVCLTMDWKITVTSTNDSFRGCARFIVDAAERDFSAQWSPWWTKFWCVMSTDVIGAYSRKSKIKIKFLFTENLDASIGIRGLGGL